MLMRMIQQTREKLMMVEKEIITEIKPLRRQEEVGLKVQVELLAFIFNREESRECDKDDGEWMCWGEILQQKNWGDN